MNSPGYKASRLQIIAGQAFQFAEQPVAMKLVGVVQSCTLEELRLKGPNVQELIDRLFFQVIDGESTKLIAQMPVKELGIQKAFTTSGETFKGQRWSIRFESFMPLQGTWFISEFFVDHWLCFKIVGPAWMHRSSHDYGIIYTIPYCIMRWKAKSIEQEATKLCMQTRVLGRGHWGDSWKGSDDALFEEKKRMFLKASEMDPKGGCGWAGLFRIYRKRGMMKEANAALDAWKAVAPPEKHKNIENIRHDRIEL